METNKLDKNVQNKFKNRTFKPSASAWERLSVQLDEQPKQKKTGWFYFVGAAASILILVSIGIYVSSDKPADFPSNNEVVIAPIDTTWMPKKNKLIEELNYENAIVRQDSVVKKTELSTQMIAEKSNNVQQKNIETKKIEIPVKITKDNNIATNNNEFEVDLDVDKEREIKVFNESSKSSIKINSLDLLYAVTHSPNEVNKYDVKNNMLREDVLKTIQNQLKESNLKINPNAILAEVERSIDDDFFQNNFMKTLKKRVTDIATVIASRND